MRKILLLSAVFCLQTGPAFAREFSARPNTAAHTKTRINLADGDRIGPRENIKQVQGVGTVARLLSDDNDGSRHQRFILRLQSGQTLLVAHNIDLAPRLNELKVGDTVEYNGEYKWNAKGGLVHWTHRDPAGRHVDGWLKHNGRLFQ